MNIGFLGAGGNMAGAILGGLRKQSLVPDACLYLFDPRREALEKFEGTPIHICASISEVVASCDYVVLAVKPQKMAQVLTEMRDAFRPEQCLVSIAAGITTDSIQKAIGVPCKVIRVMPNTPLMLGEGASALCATPQVDEQSMNFVKRIFSASGLTVCCGEAQLNAVTAVSGSGPAYVFRFAREVIAEAARLGLPEETASALFIQTLIGSAVMLRDSGKSPQQLIDMVTSPKGTTLAALEQFDVCGLDAAIASGVKACADRAEELGRQA